MTPSWIDETVRAFGRQLGLSAFSLNDRRAAGARFENGFALYLEYGEGGMMVSVGLAADGSEATLRKLLALAHPEAGTGLRLRAVWFERTGEARFIARIDDRDLSATVLEQTFRTLWQAAEYFGRSVA